MAALTIHLNELASSARALHTALCGALRAMEAGEDVTAEIMRAALSADMVERSALKAVAASGKEISQPMKLMTSNASDEWYTPPWVLELGREILGGIDLDPASCEVANRAVRAERFYTQDEDGYMKPWAGRIWLNPPFSNTGRWAARLAAAYQDGAITAGLLLVNSAPGYTWYEELVDHWPAAQFRKRLAFVRGDGAPAGLAKKSQTLFYFGPDPERFYTLTAPHARPLVRRGVADTPLSLFSLEPGEAGDCSPVNDDTPIGELARAGWIVRVEGEQVAIVPERVKSDEGEADKLATWNEGKPL